MKALKIMAAIALGGLLPSAALAQADVYMRDIDIVYQPEPASYQPDSTDYDLADQGKRFDIICTIAGNGHMTDCQADGDSLMDQNFVLVALGDVKKFVVGPMTHGGESTAGRSLVVTVAFQRTDSGRIATQVASNDRDRDR